MSPAVNASAHIEALAKQERMTILAGHIVVFLWIDNSLHWNESLHVDSRRPTSDGRALHGPFRHAIHRAVNAARSGRLQASLRTSEIFTHPLVAFAVSSSGASTRRECQSDRFFDHPVDQ
jgi:hypothetical protein